MTMCTTFLTTISKEQVLVSSQGGYPGREETGRVGMAWIKSTRQSQMGRQSIEGEMFEAGPLRDLCLQRQVEAEEDSKRLRKERWREKWVKKSHMIVGIRKGSVLGKAGQNGKLPHCHRE